MLKIGVDAMGGDYAPDAVVRGAVMALDELQAGSRIVLFGDSGRIGELISSAGAEFSSFDIVPTTEVIGMDDHPAQAFGKKPDSSIVAGFTHLKEGGIDGFASAGSTGAMMVGCMYTVKQMEGVVRPTISTIVPTSDGGNAVLLDVGLNVDCKPDVLCQYGIIGSIFAETVLGKDKPRVALLNIGEEKEKGNLLTKATYELLSAVEGINFVGNIEAKHVFDGSVDVIVADGFVGNTIIKMAEGFYEILKSQGVANGFLDKLNYEMVGGTPVLGINSTVMIGHGCSSPLAIKNMILQTERTIKADFLGKLRETFTNIATVSAVE